MTHFSNNERSVRVDFFKPSSGKWVYTKAIIWTGDYRDCCIKEAFLQSLRDDCAKLHERYDAVCLEPYHEHAHPIMRKAGE